MVISPEYSVLLAAAVTHIADKNMIISELDTHKQSRFPLNQPSFVNLVK